MSRNQRLSDEVLGKLDEIKLERLKEGVDKTPQSYSRIILAITRTGELWIELKRRLITSNFKQNKKAQSEGMTMIIIFVAIAFAALIFFAIWGFVNQELTDTLTSIGTSGNVNMTDAAVNTFGKINTALIPGLRILSITIIFGMVLTIFLTNFLIKKHPLYFLIHVFMTVFAVILSVPVSNSYAGFLTGQAFSSQLLGFTAANYVMLNLPLWVTVIGLIGAVLLVINITIGQEALL